MEDKRSLGEYIAEHRRALGLTQRQFAERLYVTDSAVSKWERGLSYPDITLLHDICAVLGVTEHELLTASEDTEARRAGALARRYLRLLRGWKLGQAAAYGLAALVCFIADAAQDGALGWSWVVLASLMTAASLTLTPTLAPERLGGVCTLGAFTLALELLLGVCCAYVGGDWFFVAGMSVLLGAARLYGGGDWFLLPGLPMALYGLALPWGLLLALRYLRAGGLYRAAASAGFAALWYWLFPWVLDRVMALDGLEAEPPYSLLRPFGFELGNWSPASTASNVMFLILLALVLTALTLLLCALFRDRRKNRPAPPREPQN